MSNQERRKDGSIDPFVESSLPANAPTFVVGIGASAGGLESLETLFQHMPANTGMAFVVIQHLSPDFKSMMFELLARDTSMKIHRVEDGMPIEANHVYLLPPKKEIIVIGDKLHLIDKAPGKGLALPIDRFLSRWLKNAVHRRLESCFWQRIRWLARHLLDQKNGRACYL